MQKYSIKNLESLTGIKAHTLRIWEQRYNLIIPKRTPTNIRYYTDQHLRKLLNISVLYNNGWKISRIAALSEKKLLENVRKICDARCDDNDIINSLIMCMIEYNEQRFDQVYHTIINKFGFKEAILKVIYPFLEKTGVLWELDSVTPANEHFISNLIRKKIFSAIDRAAPESQDKDTYLLFLSQREMHEIGLLVAWYLLRLEGFRVIYLGQAVPYISLQESIRKTKPDVLLTFFTISSQEQIADYVRELSGFFKKKPLLVAGKPEKLSKLKSSSFIRKLTSVDALSGLIMS